VTRSGWTGPGVSVAATRPSAWPNPNEAQVAYSLGLLVAETGRIEEAASLRARAAAGMPSYARAAYNAGLALSRVGRNAVAERMLRRAAELDPSTYDIVFALGDFLLRQRRLAEVGPIADRLAATDPWRPEARQLRSLPGARR
jgi:Flp pilus assembly protein TadD